MFHLHYERKHSKNIKSIESKVCVKKKINKFKHHLNILNNNNKNKDQKETVSVL